MPRTPKPILTPAQRAALSAIGKLGNAAQREAIPPEQRREWSAKGGRAGKGVKKKRKNVVLQSQPEPKEA